MFQVERLRDVLTEFERMNKSSKERLNSAREALERLESQEHAARPIFNPDMGALCSEGHVALPVFRPDLRESAMELRAYAGRAGHYKVKQHFLSLAEYYDRLAGQETAGTADRAGGVAIA